MNKYVVAYIDWFEHELFLEQITAENWREAWMKHPKVASSFEQSQIPTDLDEAKHECFNSDFMASHILIEGMEP